MKHIFDINLKKKCPYCNRLISISEMIKERGVSFYPSRFCPHDGNKLIPLATDINDEYWKAS